MNRLFFALQPDAAFRERVAQFRNMLSLPAKAALHHPGDLHTTLHFLGPQPGTMVDRLCALPDEIGTEAFDLSFDAVELWRKPRIVCLTASRIPEPLVNLHRRLGHFVESFGISTEQRAYRPHITLARKSVAFESSGLAEPIRWRVTRFALYRSLAQPAVPRYEVVCGWPLEKFE